jgi:hypothetical protein
MSKLDKIIFDNSKFIYNGMLFVWKYRPNIGEIIVTNSIKSVLETLFSNHTEVLTKNGNPTTTSIYREVTMLPGLIFNVKASQEYGNTGIVYDDFSLVGAVFKFSCKYTLLKKAELISSSMEATSSFISSNTTIIDDKYAFAARAGNLICEPGSMLSNIISKAKQLEAKAAIIKLLPEGVNIQDQLTVPKMLSSLSLQNLENFKEIKETANINSFNYAIKSFTNFPILNEAVFGAFVRIITSDQMGEVVRSIRKSDIVMKSYYCADNLKNQLISNVFTVPLLNSDDKIAVQIEKIDQIADGWTGFGVKAAIYTCAIAYRLSSEMLQAFIIVPPTRAGYASLESGLKTAPKETLVALAVVAGIYVAKNHIIESVETTAQTGWDLLEKSYSHLSGALVTIVDDEL